MTSGTTGVAEVFGNLLQIWVSIRSHGLVLALSAVMDRCVLPTHVQSAEFTYGLPSSVETSKSCGVIAESEGARVNATF